MSVHRMKSCRRMTSILGFGLAGLVTTFLVAAVCTLWGTWTRSELLAPTPADERTWIARLGETSPRCNGLFVHSKLGSDARALFYGERGRNSHLLGWSRAGLPFRSFEAFAHNVNSAKSEFGFLEVPQLPRATARGIPFRPIWVGLLADTLTFGTLWYVISRGSGAIRKAIRRHGGRCEACAYPLRALDACPECGLTAPAGRGLR